MLEWLMIGRLGVTERTKGWMMTEQSMTFFRGIARCSQFLARQLIIVSTGMVAVGFFGTAYFLSGSHQTWLDRDLLHFAGAFALAGAASASMTQFLAGNRRRGLEIMPAIFILIAIPVVGAGIALWLAPTLGQRLVGLGPPQFFAYRQSLLDSAVVFAWQTAPTGMGLGIAIGAAAGLVLLLNGRCPRLVRRVFAGVLLVCALGSVHIGVFRSITDLVVNYRLQGLTSLEQSWYMRYERASTLGATAGAVVGATISCGAWWVACRPRPGRRRVGQEMHPVV